MLQHMLMLFGFFALILALVFWVNSAVSLLDWLIGDGQSARAFVQLSLLSLPTILVNLLPFAAFGATIYATNRLASESEIVVVQAAGYSPYRLARPVLAFGLIVTLMTAILSHILVPLSTRELDLKRSEIAQDVTARMLTEGTFVHPVKGVTFFVRDITTAGELSNVYLSSTLSEGERQSFMAERALLIKENNAPMLLMFNGMSQVLDLETKRLSVTRFDSFAYSLGDVMGPTATPEPRERATTTVALLAQNMSANTLATAHARMNKALQSLAVVIVGFGALLIGGFSRFGLWRQILLALVLLVLVKSFDNAIESAIDRTPALWPLTYTATLTGIVIGYVLLWKAAHPRLRPLKTGGDDAA